MAKKKANDSDKDPDFVSLRMVNPKSNSSRTLLEGVKSWDFALGGPTLLKDGSKIVSTGIILSISAGEGTITTAEGTYKVFKERQT